MSTEATKNPEISAALKPVPILLLISKPPTHELATLALRFAQAILMHKDTKLTPSFDVFFYADGASVANALRWQSAEQMSLTKEWQELADRHNIDLPVCVSTALARGITDEENAKRHHLSTSNIADGFCLVGLSELVMKMTTHKVIQF